MKQFNESKPNKMMSTYSKIKNKSLFFTMA